MRTSKLRRKLTAWERYSRRLEKLGQGRIYKAHVYYIGWDVINRVRRGRAGIEEIVWNWEEVGS
jgi:hypothetical protein